MRKGDVHALLAIMLSLVGFHVPVGQCTNVDNLKGTYSILPEEMRELSPLEGAIAWHTGLMRRLYDLGHMKEGEPTNMPQRSDPEYKPKMVVFDRELNTWKHGGVGESGIGAGVLFVRELFYRKPGTLSVADFKLTDLVGREVDAETFAQNVAQTLAWVWIVQQLKNILEVECVANVPDLLLDGILSDFVPAKHKRASKEGAGKESGGKIGFRIKSSTIKQALDDEVFSGYDVVRYGLLAALWSKCGNDRAALKSYHKELKIALQKNLKAIDKKIEGLLKKMAEARGAAFVGEEAEVSSAVAPSTAKKETRITILEDLHSKMSRLVVKMLELDDDAFSIEQRTEIAATVRGFSIDDLTDPEKYEQVVWLYLLPTGQPEDAPYDSAHLIIDGIDQRVSFADCMDNVLRNIINHLAYDPRRSVFSTDMLTRLTGKEPHDKLKAFYAKHSDPKRVTEYHVHDDWTEVISNIPWVEYAQVKQSDGRFNHFYYVGCLKVPVVRSDESDAFLVRKRYSLIDEESAAILFEMQPCYRALIMALNHLLNLDVFADKTLADEFKRDDFVKEYLPKVFEKFGRCDFPSESIDISDFSPGCVMAKVSLTQKGGYRMTITINIRGHGQFASERLAVDSLLVLTHITKDVVTRVPGSLQMLLARDQFKELLAGEYDSKKLRLALFAQAIDNSDNAWALLADMNITDKSWYDLMRFLIGRQADPARRQNIIFELMTNAIAHGVDSIVEQATVAATKGMKAEDLYGQTIVLALWRVLIDKSTEYAFIPAIVAAANGMRSEDLYGQSSAVKLWLILLDKNLEQAVAAAIAAATEGMKVGARTEYMLNQLMTLWRELLNRDPERAFPAAISAATEMVKAENRYSRDTATALWRVLLDNNPERAFMAASATVDEMVRSKSHDLLDTALVLLTELVEKGQALDLALRVAKTCKSHFMVYRLLQALVEKGQALDLALNVATDMVKAKSKDAQGAGLSLWGVLFKQGRGFKEARELKPKLDEDTQEDLQYYLDRAKASEPQTASAVAPVVSSETDVAVVPVAAAD